MIRSKVEIRPLIEEVKSRTRNKSRNIQIYDTCKDKFHHNTIYMKLY